MCCAVHLQAPSIGVTTRDPDSGSVPHLWNEIDSSDQYWLVNIKSGSCTAQHRGQRRLLPWVLSYSAGNTFGCHVSGTGELHFRHNGRDAGVAWEGLPTDQPLWGFMEISGWMVEAKYLIPKGEAVFCDVVYGVMFVSLNACYSVTSHALHFTSLLCESYRYSSL